MTAKAPRVIGDLTPIEFENFTYDLLQSSGMRHLVWRTPGPDGGRDVEGEVLQADLSGHTDTQRWYIECKRYSNSIDWPTVWKKIAYAESNQADFLLLVTNSNPSPQCETQIEKWNAEHRSVKLRVWRGYEIEGLLNAYPVLAAKYGLRQIDSTLVTDFLDLGFEISKISQSTYASYEFGTDVRPGLEASAALSELLSEGMGVVGIHIHGLKNLDGYVSVKGKNPFRFIGYGNTGKKLSSIVKCYDPAGSNSKERYTWISKHLANAANEAVKIRGKN